MIDDAATKSLLCRAIHVLAEFDINLVITSRPGEAYYFELEGRQASERDVIVRAAMLDPGLLAGPGTGRPPHRSGRRKAPQPQSAL